MARPQNPIVEWGEGQDRQFTKKDIINGPQSHWSTSGSLLSASPSSSAPTSPLPPAMAAPPPQINKVFLKNGLHTYGKKNAQGHSLLKKGKLKHSEKDSISQLPDWQKIKKITTHSAGKVVGKQTFEHICIRHWWECKSTQPSGKNFGNTSQN